MKTTIPRNSISILLLIPLVLACFGLSPAARAVLPAPDGGYPNANTAEGDDALFSLASGFGNTANGADALFGNTSGSRNTAVGTEALFSNSAGGDNTATGVSALHNNTIGHDNTATGLFALYNNTGSVTAGGVSGSYNTAVGSQALLGNTTGTNNTAMGFQALFSNIDIEASFNTAVGSQALFSNTGQFNSALGWQALFSNTTGIENTATGTVALYSNTTGLDNTATGHAALAGNTTGRDNTATGDHALSSNTGDSNTANGSGALFHNTGGFGNTASGYLALFFNTTGSGNIALGVSAGQNLTTGDNNIDIGNQGVAAEASTIRIGRQGTQTKTFMAGIIGAPIAGPTVHINGTGQLGIGPPSSARFKDEIKPMDKASEAILALKPVSFRYKKELDPERIPQFGLVAEQVEKVNPALITRDRDGKPETVRYEAVNAMLLNEFLKEHRKVKEQQATITELKKEMKAVVACLNEQAAQIQKVSAQLELKKPAPRTVSNDQR